MPARMMSMVDSGTGLEKSTPMHSVPNVGASGLKEMPDSAVAAWDTVIASTWSSNETRHYGKTGESSQRLVTLPNMLWPPKIGMKLQKTSYTETNVGCLEHMTGKSRSSFNLVTPTN